MPWEPSPTHLAGFVLPVHNFLFTKEEISFIIFLLLQVNFNKMGGLHKVTFILLVIGGLNWGLEFFGWGIGSWSFIPAGLASLIYLLVGISALVEVFTHKQNCKNCETKAPMASM